MYRWGRGVLPEDHAEAVHWFRLAADQGDPDAQATLGAMYAMGQGVLQESAEALRWLHLAAAQGHPAAPALLGILYDAGERVPQDSAHAALWLGIAAERGQHEAQVHLGRMYAEGRGVSQDRVAAYMWISLSGHRGLETVAAEMTPEQVVEAERRVQEWLGIAAERGQKQAQVRLGRMYDEGQSVAQDRVAAYMWISLSGYLGEREKVAAEMTPEQIAEAERRVQEWKPTLPLEP